MHPNGFALWPIPPFGFDDEGEGSGGGDGGQGGQGGQGQGQGNGNGNGSQGNSGGQGGSDDDDDDPYEGLTAKELKARLAAETRARTTAETDKKALEDEKDATARSKRDKVTNLEADVAAANTEIAELKATNSRLALVNAILNDRDYQWHNANIVAQQLDSSKVTVDPKTGTVDGLKKELKRVSEDHDYLLASKKDDKGQGNGNGQGNGQQKRQPYTGGPTGIQPGQGGAANGGLEPKPIDELMKEYPALAARR